MRREFFLFSTIWIRALALAAEPVLPLAALAELTGTQKSRAAGLHKVLLAPCCWSETVATHRSEVALEIRAEINRWIAEGKSDREILDAYKNRYGMRILVEPEGQRAFWVHLAPPVVLFLGCGWVMFVIHKWLKRHEQTA